MSNDNVVDFPGAEYFEAAFISCRECGKKNGFEIMVDPDSEEIIGVWCRSKKCAGQVYIPVEGGFFRGRE